MPTAQAIELVLILIVVVLQFIAFFTTKKNISDLKKLFPDREFIELIKAKISVSDASSISSKRVLDILKENAANEVEFSPADSVIIGIAPKDDRIIVDLIKYYPFYSAAFMRVFQATNTYLIRNKNHAADFVIIQDIADREVHALENQAEVSLNLPLYLGLIGTVIGIIIGMGFLFFEEKGFSGDQLEEHIPQLLAGVSMAMTASFIGLALTVYNSAVSFKSALRINDSKRNDYFTYLRAELLPHLAKDMASSLSNIQQQIKSFNEGFAENLGRFEKTIYAVYKNIETQDELIAKLDKIEIKTMAVANVKTFQELNKSKPVFTNFIESVSKMNGVMDSSSENLQKLGSLSRDFEYFRKEAKLILEYIYEATQGNKLTNEYLKENFSEINQRTDILKKQIRNLDGTFIKSAEVLQGKAEQEMEKVRKGMVNNLSKVEQAYEKHAPQFTNLKHLSTIDEKLTHLIEATLKKEEKPIQVESREQELINELTQLNETMLAVVRQLNKPSWLARLFQGISKKRKKSTALPNNKSAQIFGAKSKRVKSSQKPISSKKSVKKKDEMINNVSKKAGVVVINRQKHFAVASMDNYFALELDENFVSRKHIFEIEEIADNRAIYRIVEDSQSKEIAMRELFPHVENAAEVIDNERDEIVNIEDGELMKTTKGWEITKKAIIEI